MIKKYLFFTVIMICCALSVTGCRTSMFSGRAAKDNESEIIISVGGTIGNGQYIIYLNGDTRRQIKSRGGSVKYIVPNGQHVIMAVWQDPYGTSTEMVSYNVNAGSNRTYLYLTKPGITEQMEIVLVGITALKQESEL